MFVRLRRFLRLLNKQTRLAPGNPHNNPCGPCRKSQYQCYSIPNIDISSRTARYFEAPMTISSIPKLFQPIRVGTANLQHRVVMAPMSRFRANAQHVQGPLAVEYYKQRTSVPGTLAITEGTIIAAQAGGNKNIPGIWSDEQISGWSKVRCSSTSRMGSCSFLHIPSPATSFMTGRRRCTQKWLVHLPPAPSARPHRGPRRPTRRRVPSRRTESHPTPTHQKQKQHVVILTASATRATRTNGERDRGVRAAVPYGSTECRSWRGV